MLEGENIRHRKEIDEHTYKYKRDYKKTWKGNNQSNYCRGETVINSV